MNSTKGGRGSLLPLNSTYVIVAVGFFQRTAIPKRPVAEGMANAVNISVMFPETWKFHNWVDLFLQPLKL